MPIIGAVAGMPSGDPVSNNTVTAFQELEQMEYKTELARVSRTLWGLKPDAQSVIYMGEEIEEASLINRITEGGWKLVSVAAIASDVLGGTSEIILRYYLSRE